MHGPAQILDRLVDPQTILPALLGPKAVVLDFESPQHSHARLGQRVALHSLISQKGRHPLEVLFEVGHNLSKWLRVLAVNWHPLQLGQCAAGLLLVSAVFEDAPHAPEEGAQFADVALSLDSLGQLRFLLRAPPRFGFEEQVAVLPQALGQGLQLLLVPGSGGLLATGANLLPARHGPFPQLPPHILQDVEVVVLDGDRRAKDGADRVVVGRAPVSVEG